MLILRNSLGIVTRNPPLWILRKCSYSSPVKETAQHESYEDKEPLEKTLDVKAMTESLAARGFSRSRASYKPPSNVEDIVLNIAKSVLGDRVSGNWKDISLEEDRISKYKLLVQCMKEMKHEVSNSYLYSMRTLSDVVAFFSTPVEGLSAYDQLVRDRDNLPKNLHVIPNPIRFNPEDDTFFGGKNAYPGSSTIVSGLRTRKKYKGYKAKISWADV